MPPFLRTRRENVPLGYFAVPLNIICSSMCESPGRPHDLIPGSHLVPDLHRGDGAFGTSTRITFMSLDRVYSFGSTAWLDEG